MSTFAIGVPRAAKTKPLVSGLARFASALWALVELFDEAQRHAEEARRRYPFIAS